MSLASIVSIVIAWFLVKFAPGLATAIIVGVVGFAIISRFFTFFYGGNNTAKKVRK